MPFSAASDATVDLSNPDAMAWIDSYCNDLMETFGVDGFKFDAGGPNFIVTTTLPLPQRIATTRCVIS